MFSGGYFIKFKSGDIEYIPVYDHVQSVMADPEKYGMTKSNVEDGDTAIGRERILKKVFKNGFIRVRSHKDFVTFEFSNPSLKTPIRAISSFMSDMGFKDYEEILLVNLKTKQENYITKKEFDRFFEKEEFNKIMNDDDSRNEDIPKLPDSDSKKKDNILRKKSIDAEFHTMNPALKTALRLASKKDIAPSRMEDLLSQVNKKRDKNSQLTMTQFRDLLYGISENTKILENKKNTKKEWEIRKFKSFYMTKNFNVFLISDSLDSLKKSIEKFSKLTSDDIGKPIEWNISSEWDEAEIVDE